MSIWKTDEERKKAKAERERNKNEREKAKIERYKATTDTRQKKGGAGMEIRFYNLNVAGKKAKVRRAK